MMAVVVVALCVVLVPAVGGTWRRLARLQLPLEYPVLVLFTLQGLLRGRFVAVRVGSNDWTVFLWACVCFALLFCLVFFWRRIGCGIMAVGLMSNLLVVLLNSGMPYVYRARVVSEVAGSFYHAAHMGTHLVALGDVLPDPTGRYLVSLGDLLLCTGAVIMVVATALDSHESRGTVVGGILMR